MIFVVVTIQKTKDERAWPFLFANCDNNKNQNKGILFLSPAETKETILRYGDENVPPEISTEKHYELTRKYRLQSIVLGFSDLKLKVCSTFGHIAQISNPKSRATSYVVCLPWSHFQKVLVGRMLMWFYFLLAPRCHLRLPCSQLCLAQAAHHLRRLQMKRNLLADPPQWLNGLWKNSYPTHR